VAAESSAGEAKYNAFKRKAGHRHHDCQAGQAERGGYNQCISQSDDGRTLVISYDGSNCWIWNEGAQQWDNTFNQNSLPAAYQKWGQPGLTQFGLAFGAVALAVAPSDYTRLYVVVHSTPNTPGLIWKSTNRGTTWTDTGKTAPMITSTPRAWGPSIAVDPVNPDVVFLSDDAGAIWYTADAFATISCLSAPAAALDGVLPSVVTTATTATASGTITVANGTVPAAVSSRGSYSVRPSNVSRNGSITISSAVAATTRHDHISELGYWRDNGSDRGHHCLRQPRVHCI
jgi:hypothetical protein